MAKRMTDSMKWNKEWFHSLKPDYKLAWLYMLDNCDSAGCWNINWKLMEFQIGKKICREDCLGALSKNVILFDNNERIFIQDFIEFQYKCSINELNPDNNAHLGAIRIIEKYSLKSLINEGLKRGSAGTLYKDKDKVQDKDKEKNKDKEQYLEFVFLTKDQHSKLIEKHGEEKTGELIKILNNYLGQSEKNRRRYDSHYHAILNWVVGEYEERASRGKTSQQSESERARKMVEGKK